MSQCPRLGMGQRWETLPFTNVPDVGELTHTMKATFLLAKYLEDAFFEVCTIHKVERSIKPKNLDLLNLNSRVSPHGPVALRTKCTQSDVHTTRTVSE